MHRLKQYPHSGFTLLELVLVLFLVGLMASAGLLFTQSQEEQLYFDDTQRRLETIREAIIRSSERSLNGQPELAGFVVDMGRLPYCLEELVYTSFDVNDSSSSPTTHYESPCHSSISLRKPTVTDAGIRMGWYGPYIQVTPEQDGFRRFRDGYNNSGADNFGWEMTLSQSGTTYSAPITAPIDPIAESLFLHSLAYDLNSSVDDYPQPGDDELVMAEDWLAQHSFTIQFVNTSASSAINDINTGDEEWTFTLAKSSVDADAFESVFTFTPPASSIAANMGMYEHTTTITESIPVGYYRVNVVCGDADGGGDNCPQVQSSPFTIMLLPRQQLGPIRWNIHPQ
jgi:prepilin-type N-terminal cleavage/methylation domain-containing protein